MLAEPVAGFTAPSRDGRARQELDGERLWLVETPAWSAVAHADLGAISRDPLAICQCDLSGCKPSKNRTSPRVCSIKRGGEAAAIGRFL
jgi:hypothetical protein